MTNDVAFLIDYDDQRFRDLLQKGDIHAYTRIEIRVDGVYILESDASVCDCAVEHCRGMLDNCERLVRNESVTFPTWLQGSTLYMERREPSMVELRYQGRNSFTVELEAFVAELIRVSEELQQFVVTLNPVFADDTQLASLEQSIAEAKQLF